MTVTIPSSETSFAVAYFCTKLLSSSKQTRVTEQDVLEATTLDGNSFSGACLPGLSSSPLPLHGNHRAVDGLESITSAIAGVNYLVVSAPNDDFNFPFTNATQFWLPGRRWETDEVLVAGL